MPNILYTVDQRKFVIDQYYNGLSQEKIRSHFYDQFDLLPSKSTIGRITQKFINTGNVNPALNRLKYPNRGYLDEQTKVNICAAMEADPYTKPGKIAHDLGLTKYSILKNLKENGYKPYKPRCHQRLFENDYLKREEFSIRMMEMMAVYQENFSSDDICFTDECTVSLADEPNKQLVRLWSRSWPEAALYESRTQYQQKVNIWAGMVGSDLIGPFIINGNLTGPRYYDLLVQDVIPAVRQIEIRNGECTLKSR